LCGVKCQIKLGLLNNTWINFVVISRKWKTSNNFRLDWIKKLSTCNNNFFTWNACRYHIIVLNNNLVILQLWISDSHTCTWAFFLCYATVNSFTSLANLVPERDSDLNWPRTTWGHRCNWSIFYSKTVRGGCIS
jgi:hypothetical protein